MVAVPIGDPPVEYDAYTSVEDADLYLAGDVLRAAGWATRNADAKGRAIVSATRMMQTLPWCDGTVPDPTVEQASPIPEVAAMLAADLATKPKLSTDMSGDSNIKAVRAGPASVEFFSPVGGGTPLPPQLWGMLITAGLICPDSLMGMAGAEFTGLCGSPRPLFGRYPWDWPVAECDYDG